MKIWFWAGVMAMLLTGCGAVGTEPRAEIGQIGTDIPISREMAAKTIACAFYEPEELEGLSVEKSFSDVSEADWSYPYIAGCVAQGFFAGSEEGTFRPQDELTLWEAQALMDRLAPDYNSRIVLTKENQNRAVSYELWVQLLETALTAQGGGLEDCGLEKKNAVLLEEDGLFDSGSFGAAGLELSPYLQSRITFLAKGQEIVALLTVEAHSPLVRQIYCHTEDGRLLLETGEGTAAFPYGETVEKGIYDVKLEAGEVTAVTPLKALEQDTVKRVNRQEIYLAEQGERQWAADARIYDATGAEILSKGVSALLCGTEGAAFYERDGTLCAAVIETQAQPERMRVLLTGKEQERVTLSAEQGFTLSNRKGKKQFPAGAEAVLTADLPWFSHGIVTAEAATPICLHFADGTTHSYSGTLELERRGEHSFSIINEVPMEEYLMGVVPYEMPTSFGETALEAQAITARSYAYNAFYSNAYCGYGAQVTDTVASQVYGGADRRAEVQAAVEATEGLCAVTEEGTVAQTYFYSTSCGFGAGSEEVWSADGSFAGAGRAYLQPNAYGVSVQPQTEEEWLAFWQDWQTTGWDEASPWYRWKVYFSGGQLSEIAAETLQQTEHCTIEGDPKELGRLTGIAVTKRGKGGVAMELELVFEKGKARVWSEYAIRQVLSPTKRSLGEPIYLQQKGGASLTGNRMLPSGFFAVKEMRKEDGTLTGVALYGGGSGHGVGMSQYGAKRLAEEGQSAAEIIAAYFPGTRVEKVL